MKAIAIYIDADACPVKQEVYRVAERHLLKGVSLKVFVVSNSPIAVPRDAMIERVVVGAGMDEADNWIAERAGPGGIVITADVPLASRCVKAGAVVLAPNGRPFTPDSIGMTLATRNLMDSLRSTRRNHRRPQTVRAARPLQLSRRARSGNRPPRARRIRVSGPQQTRRREPEPDAARRFDRAGTSWPGDRHDPQARVRQISPLFAEEESEDRQAPQSRHLQFAGGGRAA